MTIIEETINLVEIEALNYAITVAQNCDNLADFINVMQERQNEVIRSKYERN